MLRILFAAAVFTLLAPAAFACEGQTGKVIFEDKFTDDSGGWNFDEANGLVLKAPGATLMAVASDSGTYVSALNQTFTATGGDFCTEVALPPDAAKIKAGMGVIFWGKDSSNFWAATAFADGRVILAKRANDQWSTIVDTKTNNVVKTGPTDVNSVRVVVKNGTITIIVNKQTVKSIRALIPSDDLQFGFKGSYLNASTTPVLFSILSYKVTASE